MTLAELAKQLDTTTMTIYRRLDKRGMKIKELRDIDTGEITAAGASIIASMFGKTNITDAEQETERNKTGDAERYATDTTAGDAASLDVLRAKLEGANALIEQLTNERDALRAQLATAAAALEREQTDRQHERILLTAGNANDQRRLGLFSWLRKRE